MLSALSLNVLYVNPPSGTLPASEWDLGFPEVGLYVEGEGLWTTYTGSFTVPTLMPWPSDLYLVIRYMPEAASAPALIDNVSLGPEISTSVNSLDGTSGIRIAPVPAQDRITVSGLDLKDRNIGIFDGIGVRAGSVIASSSSSLDISGLAPGVYVLRQGTRSARFVKE